MIGVYPANNGYRLYCLKRYGTSSHLGMNVDWFVLGPRKSRGWDFRAVLRSDRDWWRWSERISGEHWRRLLMLSASSLSAFDTSAESRMQGSLKRARTVLGVWHDKSRSTIIGSMSIYRLKNHVT